MSTPLRIDEECACGAHISVTGSPYRHDDDSRSPRGAEEVVERWRADHQHHEPTPSTEDSPNTDADRAVALEREAVIRHLEGHAEMHRARRNRNRDVDSTVAGMEHARFDSLAAAAEEIARGAHTRSTPVALASDDA